MSEIKYRTIHSRLPSMGKIYPPESPLSEGEVEMKYGSAQEENILVSRAYIQKGIVFDKLLDALIIDKSIDQKELVLGDRNALIIEARRAMYGDEYKFQVECPRCGERTNGGCDLSKLTPYKLDWDNVSQNEFSFESSFGNKFVYKLLTYGEDQTLERRLKKLKSLQLSAENTELTDRLSESMLSVNGKTDRNEIISFIKNMPSIESKELRNHMLSNTPDIDTTFDFTCAECGHSDYLDIPIDVNFFWDTGRKR